MKYILNFNIFKLKHVNILIAIRGLCLHLYKICLCQTFLYKTSSHIYYDSFECIEKYKYFKKHKYIQSRKTAKEIISHQFSSVQSLSHVGLFAAPWTAACQASLSITNCQSLPKLMSIDSVMPSNHLILCRPLLLLPAIFPSIRVFSNKSALRMRWPMYWSFSFSISPSNEQKGLISFRMDWLDLLAVQGTLKSLLRHHSLKASIHQC